MSRDRSPRCNELSLASQLREIAPRRLISSVHRCYSRAGGAGGVRRAVNKLNFVSGNHFCSPLCVYANRAKILFLTLQLNRTCRRDVTCVTKLSPICHKIVSQCHGLSQKCREMSPRCHGRVTYWSHAVTTHKLSVHHLSHSVTLSHRVSNLC